MKQIIFDTLRQLDIQYANYEHEAVFSCDDAKWVEIPGVRVKSLLLRNKKATNYYMVVLPDYKQLDTNIIRAIFHDSKMSFASEERMLEKIWVKPGSVSPFALIHNKEKDIKLVIDAELRAKEVWFHPLENDNTVVLDMIDLDIFLDEIWSTYLYHAL